MDSSNRMQHIDEAFQRIARIVSHLNPPSSQMEEVALLRGSYCRAKGGSSGFKVAILGAAGGIGQPLALLMKMNPFVSVLHLYDVNTPGVTYDISLMNTVTGVTSKFSSHMNTGAVVNLIL